MDREYQIQEGYLIIKAGRELDHHRAEHIREILARIQRERVIKHIIFDFSGTGFMDSSGVGMILGRYKQLKPLGGTVSVVNVNDVVKRIVHMAGLHKIINER